MLLSDAFKIYQPAKKVDGLPNRWSFELLNSRQSTIGEYIDLYEGFTDDIMHSNQETFTTAGFKRGESMHSVADLSIDSGPNLS